MASKKITWSIIGEFESNKRTDVQKLPTGRGYDRRPTFGRVTFKIDCPFCKSRVTVYEWSFAAIGKKCDCGAMIGAINSYKLIQEVENEKR